MDLRIVVATITGIAAILAAAWIPSRIIGPVQQISLESPDQDESSENAQPSGREPFEDLHWISQQFASELGRLKEQNETIPPQELESQAEAENHYAISTISPPSKTFDAKSIYVRAKPGVVAVGGISKCNHCNQWHLQCASGFVIHPNGWIVTNYHTVENLCKLDAVGVMTDNQRVFPVKGIFASSRLNDLALLKIDARNLQALPVTNNISPGETIYCLSHPILPTTNGNCFYTLTQGIASGKFTLLTEKKEELKVLAINTDYGPGSSGGPILNEHGAVVAVACQAIPLSQKGRENEPQMVWRFGRPTCSILSMISASSTNRSGRRREAKQAPPAPDGEASEATRRREGLSDAVVESELHPSDLQQQGYYRPIQIQLTSEPPILPGAEPNYQSSQPLYGILRLGDADNNSFLIVIDDPENGKSKIYIDRDGSGNLMNSGDGNWSRVNGNACSIDNVVINVPYKTGVIPCKFTFYRNKARQPDHLFYYRNSGREGNAVLDGNRYRILVIDENSDGRFNNMQNCTFMIDLNQDGQLEASPDSAEYFRLNEPFNVRGKVWEVSAISPDGCRIGFRPSSEEVAAKPYLNIGYPALEFNGQGLDGNSINLVEEANKSQYILLDFWASWCGPCRGEFSTLRRINARYQNYGLTIIGINLDSDIRLASDAANQAMLNYSHVFDGQGWKNEVALLYRVHSIPQTYLLDNQLTIVGKNLRGKALEKRLQELLGPGDEEAAEAIDRIVQEAKTASK